MIHYYVAPLILTPDTVTLLALSVNGKLVRSTAFRRNLWWQAA